MTNKIKKNYKKEYAPILLGIAKGDFRSAQVLNQAVFEGRPENIIFICQQSIEKALKAVLVHLQIGFPLVHDLGILVALLPEDKAPPFGFSLAELNQYATTRRYEEGHLELTAEEINVTLSAAQDVLNWADLILK